MVKKYEFKLENYCGKTILRNYRDEDRNGKCTTPTSEKDERVVEHLKGLVRLLNLDELNIKMEIK